MEQQHNNITPPGFLSASKIVFFFVLRLHQLKQYDEEAKIIEQRRLPKKTARSYVCCQKVKRGENEEKEGKERKKRVSDGVREEKREGWREREKERERRREGWRERESEREKERGGERFFMMPFISSSHLSSTPSPSLSLFVFSLSPPFLPPL